MLATVLEREARAGDQIYGSGEIVDQLTNEGLIDEYQLMVYPVVVGSGKRLFGESKEATLQLLDATTTSAGVAVLTYAKADA